MKNGDKKKIMEIVNFLKFFIIYTIYGEYLLPVIHLHSLTFKK